MEIAQEDYKNTKEIVEKDVVAYVRDLFEARRWQADTMTSFILVIHELQKQLIKHRTLAILYEKIVKLKQK